VKASDFRNNTPDELTRKLEEISQKYLELRFQNASGTLKNVMELKAMRKDIARIHTILKEKRQ
jgi:large subunit ribosomal protein L29